MSLVFMILRDIETLMALSPTRTIIEGPREITIEDDPYIQKALRGKM